MNKPIVIAREEFSQQLIHLVNSSELPMCVIRDVFNLAIIDITKNSAHELELAQIAYQKALDKKEENDNTGIKKE